MIDMQALQAQPETLEDGLTAVVLRLAANSDEPIPSNVGHHAHAAFLNLVHRCAPDLAARLHDRAAAKPFTLSFIPSFEYGGDLLLRATSLEQGCPECWGIS